MTLPYRDTVKCDVIDDLWPDGCPNMAYGRYEVLPGEPKFCCWSHCEVALVAGMYKGPLPEAPEGLRLAMGIEE